MLKDIPAFGSFASQEINYPWGIPLETVPTALPPAKWWISTSPRDQDAPDVPVSNFYSWIQILLGASSSLHSSSSFRSGQESVNETLPQLTNWMCHMCNLYFFFLFLHPRWAMEQWYSVGNRTCGVTVNATTSACKPDSPEHFSSPWWGIFCLALANLQRTVSVRGKSSSSKLLVTDNEFQETCTCILCATWQLRRKQFLLRALSSLACAVYICYLFVVFSPFYSAGLLHLSI